ncbi:MAG TPA: glycosyltransferase family 4 protein [Gaiellaceae bacterium]|jgi:glycosyltransferase involved in cell wall biosynthesis|nr:glycosyltransferase family 4 protein [Gaiellaceae bacterium]
MRLALLTEIPAPFRLPLFGALAAKADVDLRVFFLAANDPRRNYPRHEAAFPSEVLPGKDVLAGGRWLVVNAGVLGRLRRFRPDVVLVGGWNQPAFWQALLYARVARVPLVVWVESTARDERVGRGPAELAKRTVVRAAAAFVVPGRAAAEYVRSLGVPPERITVAPNAVDLDVFGERVAAARERRDELRAKLGLDGVTFLCVSRLSPEKGVDVLARAFEGVPGELALVGDGPDRERVAALAGPTVRLLGRIERDQLVDWYAAADAFVMPSRSETWGMSMTEAAAAGLPLVASEAPGAGYDLIEEGVNGFRVPIEDVEALRAALTRVAEDGEFRKRARARTFELAAGHTPEAWAESVAAVARRLL